MSTNLRSRAGAPAIPPTAVSPAAVTNVTVIGAGLDTFIPVIPEVRETDITALFKFKTLTPISGRPTYESAQNCERELGRNALAIKVPFGGGRRGCLGLVYSNAKYQAEAGHPWTVPASQGTYPTFATGASDQDKKRTISTFIQTEKGIETVKTVEELLKNMFLGCIDEDYVVELKDGLREYDGRTLHELLAHMKKYGKMDDAVQCKIMDTFREAPDLDLPIDKYFAKQEDCQKLVADTDNPITEAGMVLQLTQHLGKYASLSKKTVRFKKKPDPADRTWAKGKQYFRECIEELEDVNKAVGIEPNLQANAAVTKTEQIEDKVRSEMADQLNGSFNALASAAVAKSETIDSNAASIASLTNAIAQLTTTNKNLTDQLAAALALCARPTANAPAPTIPTAVTPPPGFPVETPKTLHIINTAGVACPAVLQRGNWTFVAGQHCSTCKMDNMKHIPAACFARPENAHKKAQMIKRRRDARK